MAKKPRRGRQARSDAPPYQVFVSHATADKWLATTICELIEGLPCGVKVWRDDRDIKGGDDIPDEIRDGIRNSQELLLLATPASANRPWIVTEFGAAWVIDVFVTVIHQHVTTDGIPEMLRRKKALDLNDFDRYLEELEARADAWKQTGGFE